MVRSVTAPVPIMPNISFGQHFVPYMGHWRFSLHRPSIVHQDITTVNSVPPNAQAHIAPSNTNVLRRIYRKSSLLIDMQSSSGTQQENPIASTSNLVLVPATPVFQSTYTYVAPTTLRRCGPQAPAPVNSMAVNASSLRELADAIS